MALARRRFALSDFPESYAAARRNFLAAAEAAGGRLHSVRFDPLAGSEGEALAIDVATVGPHAGGPVLVVLSGVHGVEGFAGSVVQRRWLERLRNAPPGCAIAFVHAVNPWGFSWRTRCDAGNVDLNRNLVEDFAAIPDNTAYSKIHPILAAPAWTEDAIAAQDTALDAFGALHGAQALTDAMIGGQYTVQKGLNYGGAALAEPVRALCRLVADLATRHAGLVLLDLHTGIAARGAAAVLPFSDECDSPPARALLGAKDDRFAIGAPGVARMTGVLVAGLARRAAPMPAIAAVVEFGTVDRSAIRRALRADLALRFRPPTDHTVAAAARQRVVEAFWPSDPAWRAGLLHLADVLIDAWQDPDAVATALFAGAKRPGA